MGMFRNVRKGDEFEANGVTVKVVSGRAAVTIDADKAVKINVRPHKKRVSGLQTQRRRP